MVFKRKIKSLTNNKARPVLLSFFHDCVFCNIHHIFSTFIKSHIYHDESFWGSVLCFSAFTIRE